MQTTVKRNHLRTAIFSFGLAIIVLCLSALSVSADTTPALVEGEAQTGLLPGDQIAGGYAGYVIAYPGDHTEILITLQFGNTDPVYAGSLGMKLYGPYEFTSTGALQEDGSYEINYRADDPAELYVQVYNFGRYTVSYALSVEGLDEAEAVVEAVTVAEPAVAELPTLGAIQGTVVGNQGGAYANHAFDATANETDVTITMSYSPNEPSLTPAFGFDIWDPTGEHVATGVHSGVVGDASLWATFKPEIDGEYTIQVHNYTDGAMFSYSLATSYPDPA